MVRYFVFTLHLAVAFSLVFNSMNGLRYYVLQTNTDVFNTILSIFLNISMFLGLIGIWIRTYQLRAEVPVTNRSVKIHNMD